MPEFSLDALNDDDETPLFPAGDPLTFDLPDPDGGGKHVFRCIDNPLVPDDRSLNLRTAPRAYLVATLSGFVADGADRKKCAEVLHRLFDDQLVKVDKLMELLEWLNEQQDAARKRRAKEKLRRPTGAPSPSLPS